MRKTIVVAIREYQAAVQTKAFVITLVAMPILMGASIAAQVLLEDKVDTTDRTVAIVDATGVLYETIAKAARERNDTQIFTTDGGVRKQYQPRFIVKEVQSKSKNLDQDRFDLSERIRADELFAFVIIPRNLIDPDTIQDRDKIEYYSNSPAYFGLSSWLREVVNDEIQRLRFVTAGLDPMVVDKATQPVPIEDLGLVSMDESGRITKAEKTNKAVTFGVPIGLMMLMLMVVMIGASPLVQSVIEEKMQRIAEVLLGSIPPFQLMMGKLLGTVGVSLTISAVYLIGAYGVLAYLGYADMFPTHLLWWFVLYQALAVLMFGSLFIAVGAAVSDLKESQSMLMPVMILIMLPMFFWTIVLESPTSTFSVAISLFPPATPMIMLLRQAIPPGVPFWQPLVGIIGVALTTVLFVFAAGRIFRMGILMQGKGAKFSEMLHWALRG